MSREDLTKINRRKLLIGGSSLGLVSLLPVSAMATPETMKAAIFEHFGDGVLNEGRVNFSLPPIAENGYSVSLDVEVESPMTEEDHVRRIMILSERNPVPTLAQFHLGPRAGIAKVSTKIRLAGTQTVLAIAEMSDGSLWSGTAATVVTLAACVVM